ncbi:hypothetical protein LOTGIDRAFT_156696 [Lottia gigantea]|uniref:Uncharacterized protein n=1 Tax=Lottia gigantea TaxID=225164 RepID=V4AYP4_LOTGI|nr:hypothetical protein LOTGIDRAFT_156696 [Lottia gigantea]ESP02748.1 hypothetical protein LOTGIDRAFT_156696 [Lottia gigantea]
MESSKSDESEHSLTVLNKEATPSSGENISGDNKNTQINSSMLENSTGNDDRVEDRQLYLERPTTQAEWHMMYQLAYVKARLHTIVLKRTVRENRQSTDHKNSIDIRHIYQQFGQVIYNGQLTDQIYLQRTLPGNGPPELLEQETQNRHITDHLSRTVARIGPPQRQTLCNRQFTGPQYLERIPYYQSSYGPLQTYCGQRPPGQTSHNHPDLQGTLPPFYGPQQPGLASHYTQFIDPQYRQRTFPENEPTQLLNIREKSFENMAKKEPKQSASAEDVLVQQRIEKTTPSHMRLTRLSVPYEHSLLQLRKEQIMAYSPMKKHYVKFTCLNSSICLDSRTHIKRETFVC